MGWLFGGAAMVLVRGVVYICLVITVSSFWKEVKEVKEITWHDMAPDLFLLYAKDLTRDPCNDLPR